MTAPLGTPLSEMEPEAPEDGAPRKRQNNLVPGTATARLARHIRAAARGMEEEGESFLDQPKFGVANPYGRGLAAYEPNTVWFADEYAQAHAGVQDARMAEEQAAAEQLLTGDFSMGGNGGKVSGVPYADLFNQAGAKYGLNPSTLAAIARAESNFNPRARSHAGAQGLMQFMPGTARGLGVNPWDPRSSVFGAAQYLKQQLDRFGSLDLALAAYNAGPGNVQKYGGIPPFAETQAYVRRVRAFMQDYGTSGGFNTGGAPNFAGGGFVEASGRMGTFVSAAMNLASRRVPYVWGGTTASGVDCSGLIYYAARAAGITDWKRYRAVDYGRMGTSVSLSQARSGDIVYYDNPNSDTDHVGIYIGNGRMVQAPQSGDVVRVTGVGRYTSIRRIFNDGAFSAGATPAGPAPMYNGRSFDPYSSAARVRAAGAVLGPVVGGMAGTALFSGPTNQSNPRNRRTQRSKFDRRLIE